MAEKTEVVRYAGLLREEIGDRADSEKALTWADLYALTGDVIRRYLDGENPYEKSEEGGDG